LWGAFWGKQKALLVAVAEQGFEIGKLFI